MTNVNPPSRRGLADPGQPDAACMTKTARAYPPCPATTPAAVTRPPNIPSTRAHRNPGTSYPAPRPRVRARRTSPPPSLPPRRYQPSGRCRSARQVPLRLWGRIIRVSGHSPGALLRRAPAAPTRGPPRTSSPRRTMGRTTAAAMAPAEATTTGQAPTAHCRLAGRRRTRGPRASSS